MTCNSFNIPLPFVFLDSSYALRTMPSFVKKLNRGLLWQDPTRFHFLLSKVIVASEDDSIYYNNLIKLQESGVISQIITMEAINTRYIMNNSILPLFSKSISYTNSDLPTSNLILWGDSIDSALYFKSKHIIQNTSLLIIDQVFLQIEVGKRLVDYAQNNCKKIIIGEHINAKYKGDTYNFLSMSPQSFIQNLTLSI